MKKTTGSSNNNVKKEKVKEYTVRDFACPVQKHGEGKMWGPNQGIRTKISKSVIEEMNYFEKHGTWLNDIEYVDDELEEGKDEY